MITSIKFTVPNQIMRFLRILIFFVCGVVSVPVVTHADERSAARKELFELLENRQKLFDNYNSSLKKKSGIFGNRTKNDMRASHATLQDIVDIDNKIMNSLERVIDTKNYEKTALTFDQNSNQERINNLLKVNEVTLIKNEKLLAEKKQLSSEILRMKFYFVILLLVISFLLYKLYKKNTSE